MKRLVDVVNLNSDASCLKCGSWLQILSGGWDSTLLSLLRCYKETGKKVSLGIIGNTVADIASWNPEAIEFINSNRDIFEIVLRPFSHDVALLRSYEGFKTNFRLGANALKNVFGHYTPYFLPPEFILTNIQLAQLTRENVQGVFVNAARFNQEIRGRIPVHPYRIAGVNASEMNCIPFTGELTKKYLESLHLYNAASWNEGLLKADADTIFTWRDGESPFLIPDGIQRERVWLKDESKDIQRAFISEVTGDMKVEQKAGPGKIAHYPVHSFLAWVKEFRMLGFVERLHDHELKMKDFDKTETAIWLSLITSDILSAVEKSSPVVSLLDKINGEMAPYTIFRSERGFEGEDYLYAFENFKTESSILERKDMHMQRLARRISFISKLSTE